MSFRVNFFVHLADHALRIDHETGALPELHPFPLRLANAERLHQATVGVGEQVDAKGELVAEIFVRGNIIGAHADHFNPGSIEISFGRRKRFCLDGAARRVVFWIKVDHEPLPGEVGELNRFAVLVGERKIGKGIASREHREVESFLSVAEIVAGPYGADTQVRRDATPFCHPERSEGSAVFAVNTAADSSSLALIGLQTGAVVAPLSS